MLEVIKERKSVRLFTKREIEEEKLVEIFKAVQAAPSGRNVQPWDIIVINNEDTKEKLMKASNNQEWMMTAPTFLVMVADVGIRLEEENYLAFEDSSKMEVKQSIRDTAIATSHLMLEAVNQGLSTCWVAFFKNEDIKPILNIPKDKFVLGIIPIGYEDSEYEYKSRGRKEIETFIKYEKW